MSIWENMLLLELVHFADDADSGDALTIVSIWPETWPIACRSQIFRASIPHFDVQARWLEEVQQWD